MRKITKLADRFWWHVDKGPHPGGCWLWTASKRPNGYGQVAREFPLKGHQYAHRVAFELATGRAPLPGRQVAHRCDVRACVNPDHLFEATASENIADAGKKGRLACQRYPGLLAGEKNGESKLTWKAVRAIRERYAAGSLQRELAKAFGVSQSLISRVVRGAGWKEVMRRQQEGRGSK